MELKNDLFWKFLREVLAAKNAYEESHSKLFTKSLPDIGLAAVRLFENVKTDDLRHLIMDLADSGAEVIEIVYPVSEIEDESKIIETDLEEPEIDDDISGYFENEEPLIPKTQPIDDIPF